LRYFKGAAFSSGLRVPIARPEKTIAYRMETIEEMVRGKKIIHVGCADHLPLIQEKIKQNKWFHKRLSDCTERCLGIDINPEGVDFMRGLGYRDTVAADLSAGDIPEAVKTDRWDYLVMGEILEHTDNPVVFLQTIGRSTRAHVDRTIVSVPNAFRLENFETVVRHAETINSDHRYWFTPYTLGKIGFQAGMQVEGFQLCQAFEVPRHRVVRRLLLILFPGFRDTVVMVFRTAPDEANGYG
jgi:hypothetical protein